MTTEMRMDELTAKVVWPDDRWHAVRESIERKGLRHPLTVVPWSPAQWQRWVDAKPFRRSDIPCPLIDGQHMVVIVGCQRLQAARALGWQTVPVIVRGRHG